MTSLDFKMFLALVYLPIIDKSPFSPLVFCCSYMCFCICLVFELVVLLLLPLLFQLLFSFLSAMGKGKRRADLCSHVELSFSKQVSHPESLLVIVTCSLLKIQSMSREAGERWGLVLKRLLRQNPHRFIHKCSLMLSLLSLNFFEQFGSWFYYCGPSDCSLTWKNWLFTKDPQFCKIFFSFHCFYFSHMITNFPL